MKYRTLHYLNITYCREQVYKVKVNDVGELRQRIQIPESRLHGMNLTSVLWQGDQAVAHPPKSLCRGQKVATSSTNCEN